MSPAARFTTLERPSLAGERVGYTVFRIEGVDVNSQNLPGASAIPGRAGVSSHHSARARIGKLLIHRKFRD